MPPRYPHGLKKGPFHMNIYEKGVLAMLGLSVGTGMYQLFTSPWGEEPKTEDHKIDDQSNGGVLRKE